MSVLMIKNAAGEWSGVDSIKGSTPVYGVDYLTTEELLQIRNDAKPIKGVDYEDGRTPVKGVDYFTEEEAQQFKAELKPIKGTDYFTQSEINQFKQEVTPVKGTDYFDGQPGDKGDTGDPGVYVGAEEPEDLDVKIWINPEDNAFDSLTEALDAEATARANADTEITAALADETSARTADDDAIIAELQNKIADVKVNGQSIVADGVAEIPIASNDKHGVFKTNGYAGVFMNGDILDVNVAGQSNIDLRASQQGFNRVLTARFLDYAVKASLTDGRSLVTWSDAEKVAARARIGADGGTYELIADVKTTEEVNAINVSYGGVSYNSVVLIVNYDMIPRTTSFGVYLGRYGSQGTSLYCNLFPDSKAVYVMFEKLTDSMIRCMIGINNNLSQDNGQSYSAVSKNIHILNENGFSINAEWNRSKVFPTGSRFVVYGKRA